MPRMPGLDFAREALTVRPDITAAITYGYARPEDNAQARLLGVGDIILKPTTVDQLAITLDQLLQERAAAGTSETSAIANGRSQEGVNKLQSLSESDHAASI